MGSTSSQEISKDCPSQFSPSYKLGAYAKKNFALKQSFQKENSTDYHRFQNCLSPHIITSKDAIIQNRKSCFPKVLNCTNMELPKSHFDQFATNWNQHNSPSGKKHNQDLLFKEQSKNLEINIVNKTVKNPKSHKLYNNFKEDNIINPRDCPYTTYTYYEPVTVYEKVPKISQQEIKQWRSFPKKEDYHQKGRQTMNRLPNENKMKNNLFTFNSNSLNQCRSTRNPEQNFCKFSLKENFYDKKRIKVQKIYKNEDDIVKRSKESYPIENYEKNGPFNDNIYKYTPNTCYHKVNFDYKQIFNDIKNNVEKTLQKWEKPVNQSQSINLNIPAVTFHNSPSHTLYLETDNDQRSTSALFTDVGNQHRNSISNEGISKKASPLIDKSLSQKLASKTLTFIRKTKENLQNI